MKRWSCESGSASGLSLQPRARLRQHKDRSASRQRTVLCPQDALRNATRLEALCVSSSRSPSPARITVWSPTMSPARIRVNCHAPLPYCQSPRPASSRSRSARPSVPVTFQQSHNHSPDPAVSLPSPAIRLRTTNAGREVRGIDYRHYFARRSISTICPDENPVSPTQTVLSLCHSKGKMLQCGFGWTELQR